MPKFMGTTLSQIFVADVSFEIKSSISSMCLGSFSRMTRVIVSISTLVLFEGMTMQSYLPVSEEVKASADYRNLVGDIEILDEGKCSCYSERYTVCL